jgi:hypothetical protein
MPRELCPEPGRALFFYQNTPSDFFAASDVNHNAPEPKRIDVVVVKGASDEGRDAGVRHDLSDPSKTGRFLDA